MRAKGDLFFGAISLLAARLMHLAEHQPEAHEKLRSRIFIYDLSSRDPISSYNILARWPDAEPEFFALNRADILTDPGVPIETMRDQLGHTSSVLTLDLYSHAGDDREGAAEAIENYVQTCGKRNPRNHSVILMTLRRRKLLKTMARSERFELPTFWFVARRSIQLSYERAVFVTLMLTSACSAVKQ